MSSLYVANCYPNGEIDTTSQSAIVDNILMLFNENGLPSPTDITTFAELIQLIQGTSEPDKQKMVEIYDSIVTNPYSGMPITGPSNPRSCKVVVYKPNNYQFATEGAVSSSTLNLARNVNTIDTNLARLSRNKLVFKNKTPKCNPIYFFKNGDHTSCASTKKK